MLRRNSLSGGISAGRFCSLYTVSFKITSQPQYPDYPDLIYTRVKYSIEQILQEDIIPQLVKACGNFLIKVELHDVFPLSPPLGIYSVLEISQIIDNLDV
jgi:hypothetical protein